MFYRIIDSIARVCKEYHERIGRLEDEKFDLEYIVKRKDMEVERWAAKAVALFWGTHKTYKDLNFIFKKSNVILWHVKCRVVFTSSAGLTKS